MICCVNAFPYFRVTCNGRHAIRGIRPYSPAYLHPFSYNNFYVYFWNTHNFFFSRFVATFIIVFVHEILSKQTIYEKQHFASTSIIQTFAVQHIYAASHSMDKHAFLMDYSEF